MDEKIMKHLETISKDVAAIRKMMESEQKKPLLGATLADWVAECKKQGISPVMGI